MALTLDTPGSLTLKTNPISQEAFAPFGTLIQNPHPDLIPSPHIQRLPPNAQQANQGSALKYQHVTHMKNFYGTAPSDEPARAVMNMFVCAPRSLVANEKTGGIGALFQVDVLERHPYTTQTFIPLGLSASERREARYLVIVAPTLPASSLDEALPVPPDQSGESLPGRGLPDLANVRAFMVQGSQAVTYGAGTWHAPMVALGQKPIDFVVVQFANGVAIEDCQEVELRKSEARGIFVEVPEVEAGRELRSKL